jgi:hypothetical protein
MIVSRRGLRPSPHATYGLLCNIDEMPLEVILCVAKQIEPGIGVVL